MACHEHPSALQALKIDDPKWARGPQSRSQRSRCLRAWRIFEGKVGERYQCIPCPKSIMDSPPKMGNTRQSMREMDI